MAGVVGKLDDLRGTIVVAFVQLTPGYQPSGELAKEVASHVKARLAAYEYPREVHFLEAMPQTATGKIIRGKLREMLNG
jgi:acetyl-CoA synthetase